MKKSMLSFAVAILLFVTPALAEDLKVGMKATDWSFKDTEGKIYTMASWAGKVLLVNYVDPDKADLNEHFQDAMKKAVDEKRLKKEHYKGIGIADCAATWKPNFAIRLIAGRKAKKYNTTILFDYKAILREAWGLKKDTANAILLDKNRICRVIVRGRVSDDQVEKLVQLAIDLQYK
jgi:predicted transcriptional regulator